MIHYYIIDLETNGLRVNHHEIIEISIIRCSDKHQLSRKIKCKFPERSTPKALEVTNKTFADLLEGESIEEVIKSCNEFFDQDGVTPEERCIIGHNIYSFDRRFLFATWGEYNQIFPASHWLDTMTYMSEYAKKNGLQRKRFSLIDAMVELGISPKMANIHTAKGDSRNNYYLWEGLKKTGIAQIQIIKTSRQEEKQEEEDDG